MQNDCHETGHGAKSDADCVPKRTRVLRIEEEEGKGKELN
jgi:hypothetical protein